MSEYRTGGHWGRTIIRVGTQRPDAEGRRADDQLVGLMDDPALAERICALLNREEISACTRVGLHNCDGEWRNHDRYAILDEPGQP